MSKQTLPAPTIPVAFVNGNTYRVLCQSVLPALPFPGDFFDLGVLAYVVVGRNWRLTPDGRLAIRIVLIPQAGGDGERPFAYPEEKEMPALWADLVAAGADHAP